MDYASTYVSSQFTAPYNLDKAKRHLFVKKKLIAERYKSIN